MPPSFHGLGNPYMRVWVEHKFVATGRLEPDRFMNALPTSLQVG